MNAQYIDLDFDDMLGNPISEMMEKLGIENIFINRPIWLKFSEEQMNLYIDFVYKHYRLYGFPYFNLTPEERRFEFNKFKIFNNPIIVDKTVRQTMHGLALAWHYFPHAWDVQCGDCKTPMQVFNNDDTFKKVIRKRIDTGSYISDGGIRKMLKMYTGVQSVSNFRPTSARAIYDTYAGDGVVWDMSCGYGGRLLGAIASERVKVYLGTDPCIPTYNGLVKIQQEFGQEKEIKILNQCSETTIFPQKSVDLCFTSPPYFNCEKYANEDSQSYIKYPTKQLWINNFVGGTLDGCYHCLKDDGVLLININDVKAYTNLVKDFLSIAKTKGFELIDTLQYALSSIHKTGFKYEPVFVFKKKNSK